MTQQIFIVDDDEAIRSALSRALQKRGYQVEAFAEARAFLDHFTPQMRGTLILDYGMPQMNGLELQQELSNRGSVLPIIFITGHGGVPETVQAIKAGAIDFLEKPFRQAVLLDCIELAFAQLALRVKEVDGRQAVREKWELLTAREMEITRYMVAYPATSSSKDVAAHLGISPRTVDHHRARILEKLQLGSVAELIAMGKDAALL